MKIQMEMEMDLEEENVKVVAEKVEGMDKEMVVVKVAEEDKAVEEVKEEDNPLSLVESQKYHQ
jgi:hypothetical protein